MRVQVLKALIILLLEVPLLAASLFLMGYSALEIIKADAFSHISLLVFLFGVFGCVISARNIKITRNRQTARIRSVAE